MLIFHNIIIILDCTESDITITEE